MESKLNCLFNIETVINFIINKNKDRKKYDITKINGYKKLIEDNKSYPSIKSNNQFRTIIESYTKNNKLKYLHRLIKIIGIVIKIPNDKFMLEHFIKYHDISDKEHYDLLKKIYDINKIDKIDNMKKIGGYMSQTDTIYSMIYDLSKTTHNIKKIMDIGCGNGKKLTHIGKKFNIKQENLICADIDNWFEYSEKDRKKTSLNLLKIDLNGPIKYDKHKISIITMIHTIHHWCYDSVDKYIERLSSLKNILDSDGYVVIVEHDIFTKMDGCITDIEHGLYECVIYNKYERFSKDFTSQYLNFVEIELLMDKSGFEIVAFQHYNAGSITNMTVPNKTYIAIYKIKK
jgi:SAM-dependent methyltransferase